MGFQWILGRFGRGHFWRICWGIFLDCFVHAVWDFVGEVVERMFRGIVLESR